MENYIKALSGIEGNLEKLRKYIKSLEEENARLREQLGKPLKPSNMLSLEYTIVDNCYIEKDGNIAKQPNTIFQRVYKVLKRYYPDRTLNALEGTKVEDLMKMINLGISSVAVIMIVCKHYGIEIEYKESSLSQSMNDKLKSAIKDFEGKIKFRQ